MWRLRATGFRQGLLAIASLAWHAGDLVPAVLVYAAGTGDIRWLALARLVGIGVLLVLIYRLFPVRDLARFDWQDLAVASVLTFALDAATTGQGFGMCRPISISWAGCS